MRQTILLLAGVLLSAVALGSDSPNEYDDKTTADPLEGTWKLIAAECDGEKMNRPYQVTMTYHRGIFTFNNSNGVTFSGSYRFTSARKPFHLDQTKPNGFTDRYVYQIDGDTLRIGCFLFVYVGEEMRQPQGFNDKDVLIETFKRVK